MNPEGMIEYVSIRLAQIKKREKTLDDLRFDLEVERTDGSLNSHTLRYYLDSIARGENRIQHLRTEIEKCQREQIAPYLRQNCEP